MNEKHASLVVITGSTGLIGTRLCKAFAGDYRVVGLDLHAPAQPIPGQESFIKPRMVDLADQHYPVDISRARMRLGWKSAHRLRDTLDEIIANLKRDPQAWFEECGLPVPANAE